MIRGSREHGLKAQARGRHPGLDPGTLGNSGSPVGLSLFICKMVEPKDSSFAPGSVVLAFVVLALVLTVLF